MKKLLFCLALFAAALTVKAQDMSFMYEEFQPAKIYLNDGTFAQAVMNFEFSSGNILYMQDGEMMEIADASKITNIEFKDGRNFYQYGNNAFFEKVSRAKGDIFVHWRIRIAQVGNKGAYGVTTQAGVHNIRSASQIGMVNDGAYELKSTSEVYSSRNDNTYIFMIGEKQHKVKNLKNIYKQFADKQEQIKAFVSDKKLSMDTAEEALQIIEYVMSL